MDIYQLQHIVTVLCVILALALPTGAVVIGIRRRLWEDGNPDNTNDTGERDS